MDKHVYMCALDLLICVAKVEYGKHGRDDGRNTGIIFHISVYDWA